MAQTNRDTRNSVYQSGDNTSEQTEKCEIKDNADCLGATPNVPECAVCLQICVHPACLPCSHVFCYLCVKGVANQSKRCPMCRQEIPADFLERPQLLEIQKSQQEEVEVTVEESLDEYQWFYEGRNGWWQYDQRTNLELETAYKQGKQSCELLIAGFLYIADFTTMFQVRRNDHSRRRRIKRDLHNAPKKGVAGLRLNNSTLPEQSNHQQQQQQETVRETEETEQPINLSRGERTEILTSDDNVTIIESASGNTNRHLNQRQQSGSLQQVLEHMRSAVSRRQLPSFSQHYSQNSNIDESFSEYSLSPYSHHDLSSQADDEHT